MIRQLKLNPINTLSSLWASHTSKQLQKPQNSVINLSLESAPLIPALSTNAFHSNNLNFHFHVFIQ